MGIAAKILEPTRFIRVRHPELFRLMWPWPLAVASIAAVAAYLAPVRIPVFGPSGLLRTCTDILLILPGFYITALAAAATFARPGLDDPIANSPPELDGFPMSRRRFVCYMFGYLALLSLTLYFVGAVANVLAVPLREWTAQIPGYAPIFTPLWRTFACVFAFGMCQMLLVTMFGLYYLTDRLYHVDPRVTLCDTSQSDDDTTTGTGFPTGQWSDWPRP